MDRIGLILIFCVTLNFFVIANGRKLLDLTHMYNVNITNSLHYPSFNSLKFNIVQRGWANVGSIRPWVEYNEFSVSEHVGTHIDAPAHLTRGPGNWRLHEIPLENLVGEAVVIDISHKADVINNPDATIEVNDILNWEQNYGRIKDGSIVLMHSGWDKYVGDDIKYLGNDQGNTTDLHYPGMGEQAAQWLVNNRKISGFGVDSLSLDAGISQTFPAHVILLSANIYGLENVKNVGKLPPFGARLYVFPMHVYDGSGGPTRIVAEFNDIPWPVSSADSISVSVALVFGLLIHMLM